MKCERFTCRHLLQRHWEPVCGSFCSSLPLRPWNSVLRWSFLEPGTCVTTMSRTVCWCALNFRLSLSPAMGMCMLLVMEAEPDLCWSMIAPLLGSLKALQPHAELTLWISKSTKSSLVPVFSTFSHHWQQHQHQSNCSKHKLGFLFDLFFLKPVWKSMQVLSFLHLKYALKLLNSLHLQFQSLHLDPQRHCS